MIVSGISWETDYFLIESFITCFINSITSCLLVSISLETFPEQVPQIILLSIACFPQAQQASFLGREPFWDKPKCLELWWRLCPDQLWLLDLLQAKEWCGLEKAEKKHPLTSTHCSFTENLPLGAAIFIVGYGGSLFHSDILSKTAEREERKEKSPISTDCYKTSLSWNSHVNLPILYIQTYIHTVCRYMHTFLYAPTVYPVPSYNTPVNSHIHLYSATTEYILFIYLLIHLHIFKHTLTKHICNF